MPKYAGVKPFSPSGREAKHLDVPIHMGTLNLIAQLKETHGIAYMYITHDLASARYIGDEIMVMYAGNLVEGGGREATINNPYHSYMHLLLSDVPDPQSGLRTRKEVTARGEVPSLIDQPPACPFAPRCPKVMDMCRLSIPAPTAVHDDHWVACCLYFSRLLK